MVIMWASQIRAEVKELHQFGYIPKRLIPLFSSRLPTTRIRTLRHSRLAAHLFPVFRICLFPTSLYISQPLESSFCTACILRDLYRSLKSYWREAARIACQRVLVATGGRVDVLLIVAAIVVISELVVADRPQLGVSMSESAVILKLAIAYIPNYIIFQRQGGSLCLPYCSKFLHLAVLQLFWLWPLLPPLPLLPPQLPWPP